jgi:opacity protein-like surface antigen
VLERLTDLGSSIRLGFGVSPLHGLLAPTPTGLAGVQEEETGTVVSFGLSLALPGATRTSAVVPYVTLGPALFVVEPDSAGRLLGTRVDSTVQLGARAGAGINWRVTPRATIFGGYELTTTAPGSLTSPGTKIPGDSGVNGHDFTGGLRLIY